MDHIEYLYTQPLIFPMNPIIIMSLPPKKNANCIDQGIQKQPQRTNSITIIKSRATTLKTTDKRAQIILTPSAHWTDTGHPDEYYASAKH